MSHLLSGMWESSKIVPTVTENCLRQARHLSRPGRVFDPGFGVRRYGSTPPQRGHTGPLGQRSRSSVSRALPSSEYRAPRSTRFVSAMANPPKCFNYRASPWVCQVYNRAFFLARTTQHLQSLRAGREVLRALVALGALIAWGGV